MKKSSKKFDFKAVATRVLVPAAVGSVATIVGTMVEGDPVEGKTWNKNADLVDYGMLLVGAFLPEIVKGDISETASTALISVGAYRMANRLDFPGKIGVNGINGIGEIPGQYNIGKTWSPSVNIRADRADKVNPANVQ